MRGSLKGAERLEIDLLSIRPKLGIGCHTNRGRHEHDTSMDVLGWVWESGALSPSTERAW